MNHILRKLVTVVAGLTLAGVMLLGSVGPAWAGDKIHLKDGRVLEGEIVREVDGSIWLKYKLGGIEQQGFFSAAQIEKIERDAAATPVPSAPVNTETKDDAAQAKRPGVPRGVVITLEETVGIQFAAKALEEVIPWLEEQQVDLVVLKINSGGGLALEVPRLHKLLYEEYKPRFRTVAWIESAISAAAMTAHILEEIYFMPEGNYGACTMYSGALERSDDYSTEKVIAMMEEVSTKGNHPIPIMRSMQLGYPLSCNRDPNGEYTWYNSDEGQHLVNPKDRILTFDAEQAARFKFSKDTADSLGELEDLLGYPEVDWLGRPVAGEIFPICKAEEDMRRWRESTTDAENRFQEYFVKYGMAVQNASGTQDRAERGMFVGLARRHLAVIERACKEHPNLMLLQGLTEEWFEEQHRLLRDLMKQ